MVENVGPQSGASVARIARIASLTDDAFLTGGGEMARRVAGHDWAATALGPLDEWPSALKIAVGMMLNSRFPKCIVWGLDLVTLYNDAFRPILGEKAEALGRSFADVWSEAWPQIGPIVEKAFAGEATYINDFPMVVERYGYPEQTHFTFCYSPIRDEHGVVRGMMDTVIETTARVETERRSRVLNAELAHRIKNTLAVVHSIANQTLRNAETTEQAARVLSERIGALTRAHHALTMHGQSEASIRDVIDGALEPHRGPEAQVEISGPDIGLSEKHAMSMALAVNELATNAVKYGALSVPDGQVTIKWRVPLWGRPGAFTFEWIERGGPAPTPPTRRGFGTRLIEEVVANDFNGTARIAFDPGGIRYTITTDAANVLAHAETA